MEKLWLVAVCLALSAVCGANAESAKWGPPEVQDVYEEIVKSATDGREYRRTQLANGLDVLLVKDDRSSVAACAVDVGTGWWNDPKDVKGLAHLHEHMLFLGNKMYPKEGEWRSYLGSHGGHSNAYTSSLNTNYYFSLSWRYLEPALERFSQFFVSPLFTASAVGREIKAVHAEHIKYVSKDNWRSMQVYQELSNTSLPFHSFSTGSVETLAHIPADQMRERLVAFWKRWYVAPNMRVAILGGESLDTLEAWARKYFSNIPSGNASVPLAPIAYPYRDEHKQVYDNAVLGSIVTKQSIRNIPELNMMWTVPPQGPLYAEKNSEYVSNMIGGEGAGSLLSVLKNKGLATSLYAGPRLQTAAFDLFQVCISLTNLGMKPDNMKEIMRLVFRQIRLVELRGISAWRWKEMGAISAVNFRLQAKGAASQYVSNLAGRMPKYQHRDLLMAPYMYQSFNEAGVQAILDNLTPENLMVYYSNNKHTVKLNKVEPVYGTHYRVEKLPSGYMSAFNAERNAQEIVPDPILPLKLQDPNEFIPDSVKIKPKPAVRMPRFPVVVFDKTNNTNSSMGFTGAVRVWHLYDTAHQSARANLMCKLWTPSTYGSPRDAVMAALFSKVIRDKLMELAFPAREAGYAFSFSSSLDGFNLRLSGYDARLPRLALMLAPFLSLNMPNFHDAKKGFTPLRARFQMIKSQLLQSYKNFLFGLPVKHASYFIGLLLKAPHWDLSQYMHALHTVSLEDVVVWSRTVFDDMSLECLAHGNLYEAEALELVRIVASSVDFQSTSELSVHRSKQVQRIVQLDGQYQFQAQHPNPDEQNSAAYVHYQYEGEGNINDDLHTEILASLIRKPAFHQLRTVEQLGYSVFSGRDVREGVNGIHVIVQSPKYSAGYLDWRVAEIMRQMRHVVHNITVPKFNTMVKGMMRSRMHTSRNLDADTNRFWYEITTQQYRFFRRRDEIKALRGLQRSQFFEFFDNLAGFQKGRLVPSKVSVLVDAAKGPAAEMMQRVPLNASYTYTKTPCNGLVTDGDGKPRHCTAWSIDTDPATASELGFTGTPGRVHTQHTHSAKDKQQQAPHAADENEEYESQRWEDPHELERSILGDLDRLEPTGDNGPHYTAFTEVGADLDLMSQFGFDGQPPVADVSTLRDVDEPPHYMPPADEDGFMLDGRRGGPTGAASESSEVLDHLLAHAAMHGLEESALLQLVEGTRVRARKDSGSHGSLAPAQEPAAAAPDAPGPPAAPAPAQYELGVLDPSCAKGGPRKIYAARQLTLPNIMAFKDSLCLFPLRPLGKPPTKARVQKLMASILKHKHKHAPRKQSTGSTKKKAPTVVKGVFKK